MGDRSIFEPARRALKPVLSDEPLPDIAGLTQNAFLTPSAQRIARSMELIVAAGAGGFLLTAWILAKTSGPKPLENLFLLLAFAAAGVPALSEVWGKISRLRIDIDLLMLLGAALAAYIGNPFEGALLLFLFALSGGLESFALRRTQSAIVALRALTPTEAILIKGDTTHRVALRQVPLGATVLVRPGEKVPIDGTVTRGRSSVDESAITGESVPRDCSSGHAVFAGTQNIDGRLEVRVTKLAADTTLAKIVGLVTEARHNPARAQRLIDRIGPTYSVVVIISAVLVGVVASTVFGMEGRAAIHRSIALLIVASPCALIIATPVAYLSAMAAAARRGVLVKGGSHLEVVARAGVVAFDKTGTLTTGNIRLTDVEISEDVGETEALRIAGAIEQSSSHPLASAVNQALESRKLIPHTVSEYRANPGEGEAGIVAGRSVWIGKPELLDRHLAGGMTEPLRRRIESLRQQGKTVSALVVDNVAGLLAFQDTIRSDADECVRRLRDQGIDQIHMLTGDHRVIAQQVASKLQLDGFLAELAPQDKVSAARELREKHGTLVLIGDGINDAPALAHADAGIAMGSMGADVSLEAADIVLMKDRISQVAWLHRHARRTASIVRQNLTLAISVIVTLSVLAVARDIPLPLAVVAHEGSTVLVALNALRLLRGAGA